ncbi:hypothetical protein [Microbispora bryophytorum]|uniref:Spore-associated protein A n=1 Tax=Microbispora bryophytorum TaxID=1460882 RepID=A0A8H9H5W6_9ACTN|nr:hypothetical protein [Microbispora bryophytorum]MBD3138503.1 hypothetical protein [Microbispora bryophytorum]TQS04305.1 hypothetical protein FLX07_21920 [Microbispora bryophytorum]GGO24053.1 hypothetical protein GCM10011574_54040 [Microbispora bryophytorum]
MKLKGTLFAAGVAMLLCAVPGAPAAQAAAASAGLLGGTCSPSLYFTQAGGAAVAVNASVSCSSSIDYLQVDVQLRRNGSAVASNVCGTTSWSVSCDTGVACQSGSYQASAQFQAYSTSGYGDYATYTTPAYTVTC